MKRRVLEAASADEGRTLSEFLSAHLNLQVEEAVRLVTQGAVYLGGRRCQRPGEPLRAGAKVLAVLEERGIGALSRPEQPRSAVRVLFEDAEVLTVDKPAGMTSQATQSRAGDSLWDWARAHAGLEVGLVHRLDRETSGVMVFGKGWEATASLAAQFKEGSARKRYLAVTGPGLPEAGVVDLPLSKDRTRIGRRVATRHAHGEAAVTEYRRLYGGAEFCLLELRPKTGRTHQIRAHLRAVGAPVAGDRLYEGLKQISGRAVERCLLHALSLTVRHPATGKVVTWDAPPPADIDAFLRLADVRLTASGEGG
ncbi:MAG TPA: RluA family pseudouridine synthase [Myxococcaceae bacterium]|nr:RluA family pseudouridine synthase [Myxococcaceae bacterium]